MVRKMGRYELVRPLGRGGMAEVFVARRRGPGGVEKRLVVKRIRRERASDPRFLQMFVEEARLSMSLSHKNIVPMFDFGRAGDDLFLAMELVDGSDLGTALAQARRTGDPLDPMLVAYVGMEACSALDYAHAAHDEQGTPRAIVHRDVTPGNVLLSSVGEVKLVDFGVAITLTEIASGSRVRGTPAYMSPEQARGDAVDGRSDVFSLGLVLWEALAGRRAYGAKSAEQLLDQARACEVPPLPESVPAALREIIDCATRAEPDERYSSARQMQIALDTYVVRSRAAGGGDPPSHRLAEWLAGLEITAATSTGEWDAPPEDGLVVTFLDDGLEDVAALGPGAHTMRSIAETVGEVGDDPDDGAGQSGDAPALPQAQPSSRSASPRHRRWIWIAVGAAGLVAMRGGNDSSATDASIVALAPADARVHEVVPIGTVDAGVAPLVEIFDAAAPPPIPIDAHTRRERTDARRGKRDAAVAAAPGSLQISSRPWAIVTVAGRPERCEETPCKITLPAGRYKLLLRNPQALLEKTIAVEVISGTTIQLKETLTR